MEAKLQVKKNNCSIKFGKNTYTFSFKNEVGLKIKSIFIDAKTELTLSEQETSDLLIELKKVELKDLPKSEQGQLSKLLGTVASSRSASDYEFVDIRSLEFETCDLESGYLAVNAKHYLTSSVHELIRKKIIYGVRTSNVYQTKSILDGAPYLKARRPNSKVYSAHSLMHNKGLIKEMVAHIEQTNISKTPLMSISEAFCNAFHRGEKTLHIAVTGSRFYRYRNAAGKANSNSASSDRVRVVTHRKVLQMLSREEESTQRKARDATEAIALNSFPAKYVIILLHGYGYKLYDHVEFFDPIMINCLLLLKNELVEAENKAKSSGNEAKPSKIEAKSFCFLNQSKAGRNFLSVLKKGSDNLSDIQTFLSELKKEVTLFSKTDTLNYYKWERFCLSHQSDINAGKNNNDSSELEPYYTRDEILEQLNGYRDDHVRSNTDLDYKTELVNRLYLETNDDDHGDEVYLVIPFQNFTLEELSDLRSVVESDRQENELPEILCDTISGLDETNFHDFECQVEDIAAIVNMLKKYGNLYEQLINKLQVIYDNNDQFFDDLSDMDNSDNNDSSDNNDDERSADYESYVSKYSSGEEYEGDDSSGFQAFSL